MEMADEVYKDFVDEIANFQFQKLFLSKFPATKLEFCSRSFRHCLRQVTKTKQPLLFFLHNEDIEESRQYCEFLVNPVVENIICEKFFILGWNINSDSRGFRQNLADKIVIVDEIANYVEEQTPAIFIIIPDRTGAFLDEATDEVITVKILHQITITRDSVDNYQVSELSNAKLLSYLEQTRELMSFFTYEGFKTMTAIKYQQLMFKKLGDRDYDSFESNEHDLLKEKILYAINGPPTQLENGIDYNPKQKEEAEKIYAIIQKKNNEFSKWNDRIVIAFIYVCVEPTASGKAKKAKKDKNYNPESEFYPTPVFVLRKCKPKKDARGNRNRQHGCRIFIDVNCRVYTCWNKYLENNTLPPCKMIFPHSGRYQCNPYDESEVWWNEAFSPSCSTTAKILNISDVASGIVGLASGAALLAATFTPAAVITIPAALAGGIGSGVYGVGRSSYVISDRTNHSQDVSLRSSESRSAYLNIGAGVLNIVGAGASKLLSSAVQGGFNVGREIQHTMTAINSLNIIAGGTATINSCYDVYQQYMVDGVVPSPLTIVQLGSSVFFFGNSIYTFRTGATMVQEMQTQTLNDISESLRSNRHRKTFNKMVKETTRVKGSVKGNAEVISSMRNLGSRDEVLAVLTRSNKNFNKMGVRFAAETGGITLNGIPTDILDFGNLPKTQQGVRLQSLPAIPENHSTAYMSKTKTLIQNIHYDNKFNNVLGVTRLDPTMILTSLAAFTQEMQSKILEICEKFTNQMDIDTITGLKTLFKKDIRIQIIEYVIDFIRIYSEELKRNFEDMLLNSGVVEACEMLGFRNPHVTIYNFIDYVIKQFFDGDMMRKLNDNFKIWYTSLEFDQQERRNRKERRHHSPTKEKKTCPICQGYFYE